MRQIYENLDMLDLDSKKSFTNLIREFNDRNMTMVCGAGVSVSVGLPNWKEYLKKIVLTFLLHWKDLERANKKYKNVAPQSMSINMLDDYFETRYPNFSLHSSFSEEDPLILAQLIKNCIEPANWRYLLRRSLYKEDLVAIFNSKLTDFLCQLVAENSKFTSIMTYNYDAVLETVFERLKFKYTSIIQENHFGDHKNFPIYHMEFCHIVGVLKVKFI